jgi:hypothetical protein
MLVLVLASIGAVASIVGLHAAQVAHAQTCIASGQPNGPLAANGNPHSRDAGDDSKANPAGHCAGNPHNSDEGEGPANGNPHKSTEP